MDPNALDRENGAAYVGSRLRCAPAVVVCDGVINAVHTEGARGLTLREAMDERPCGGFQQLCSAAAMIRRRWPSGK